MRIIKGEFRNRRILTPKGLSTRPTPEMVREALFNILGDFVVEARVLDLFAGSGGVGLEALSRGAASAAFVERDARALAVLKRNIQTFGARGCAQLVAADAYRRMNALAGREFDFIFAAPPYDNLNPGAILMGIARMRLLADGGILVIQIPSSDQAIPEVKGLVLVDERRYGRNQLTFYEKVAESGPENHADASDESTVSG